MQTIGKFFVAFLLTHLTTITNIPSSAEQGPEQTVKDHNESNYTCKSMKKGKEMVLKFI